MKRAAALITAASLALVTACQSTPPTPIGPTSHFGTWEPVRCEEDEPCWQCEEMGNHKCGPPPAGAQE